MPSLAGERWWRQPPKGDCISSPAGRLYGFRRQRRYKKWRRRRRTSPAQRYYITPEGESPQPARKASADHRQTPWRPGPKARRRHQPSRPSGRVNLQEYSPSDICRLTVSCLSVGGKRIAAGRQPCPNQRFRPSSHRALSGAGLLRCRRSRRWSPPEGCPGPGCRRRRLCPWVLLFLYTF